MSRVYIQFVDGSMNVGFTAVNRHEYEAHLQKIAAIADLIWPPMSAEGFTKETIQEIPERPTWQTRQPLDEIEATIRARQDVERARKEKYGLS